MFTCPPDSRPNSAEAAVVVTLYSRTASAMVAVGCRASISAQVPICREASPEVALSRRRRLWALVRPFRGRVLALSLASFGTGLIEAGTYIAILAGTILAGLIAMVQLPVSEYPEVVPPSVVVSAQFPGANPKVIAETVAMPLEEQINGVENLLYLSSQAASDGTLTLTVTFLQVIGVPITIGTGLLFKVMRMLRVGENTGALDVALRNVNYFYTRDVRESVDKAMKMLEPTLTMGLGLVMAFIMWAVLSPVYDILGKLKI